MKNESDSLNSNTIIIIQTWWHIEDFYKPKNGHTIRQVMDIATASNNLLLTLPESIFGLRCILRSYHNLELPFTEQKESDKPGTINFIFQLPLEKLSKETTLSVDEFKELSGISDDRIFAELHHAKIEIEYSYTFEEQCNDCSLLQKIIFDKHISKIYISGVIQPEFRITPPFGYTLNSKKTALDVFYDPVNKDEITDENLACSSPEISRENGKKRFTFYLGDKIDDKKKYLNLISDIKQPKEENCLFRISYVSKISWSAMLMTTLIPILFVFFLVFSIFLLGAGISLTLFAAYIAYVCVYISYLRDGFTMPRIPVFAVCTVIMISVVVVFLLMNGMENLLLLVDSTMK